MLRHSAALFALSASVPLHRAAGARAARTTSRSRAKSVAEAAAAAAAAATSQSSSSTKALAGHQTLAVSQRTLTARRAAANAFKAVPPSVVDSRVLSPMLASSWKEHKVKFEPNDEVFISDKMDGVRCVVAADKFTGKPFFITRKGNLLHSCETLGQALEPLFKADPSLVLDGELYVHGVGFNALVSAVRRTPSSAVAEGQAGSKSGAGRQPLRPVVAALDAQVNKIRGLMQLHVFDVLYSSQLPAGAPFVSRFVEYERLVSQLPNAARRRVKTVGQSIVMARDVDAALTRAVSRGFEGVMVRHPLGTYAFNTRASLELLKHKEVMDAEFEIREVVRGTGRLANTAGSVQCITGTGLSFKAAIGGTDEQRQAMWERRTEIVGLMGTVEFQALTPRGVPRFPVLKAVRGNKGGSDWM